MEFFKKLGGWKKSLENTAKAGAVVAALGGATFTDGATNQTEAQTVIRSVENPSPVNYTESTTVTQEYKKKFENWFLTNVLKNPKVISELNTVSKLKTNATGFLEFLHPKKEESSQIIFSPGDGLSEDLVDSSKGIEKLYMTISKTGITDKNVVMIIFTETESIEGPNPEFGAYFGYNLATGKIINRTK